jgi:hypothetical protein
MALPSSIKIPTILVDEESIISVPAHFQLRAVNRRRMKIYRIEIQGLGFIVPGVVIEPEYPKGAAVISHGYGGCKEEQLGLAWRVAEAGLVACAIDLRGHGEHQLSLDPDILADVEAAIKYCRKYGMVVAIGHSIGGRLSLISSADYAIGISPPLDQEYSEKTQESLRKLRHNKVRADVNNWVFEILKKIPTWKDDGRGYMIIYGSKDVPEIVRSCEDLKDQGGNVLEIEGALHGDTYLMGITYLSVAKQLDEWFGYD